MQGRSKRRWQVWLWRAGLIRSDPRQVGTGNLIGVRCRAIFLTCGHFEYLECAQVRDPRCLWFLALSAAATRPKSAIGATRRQHVIVAFGHSDRQHSARALANVA